MGMIRGKERKNARTKEDGAVKNQMCLKVKGMLAKAGRTCGGFFTRKKDLFGSIHKDNL